jgi:hypothetical protein
MSLLCTKQEIEMCKLPEGCDFEPLTAPEAFLQHEMHNMYTFDEIQYAWDESGAQGDWFEFVAFLGVTREQQDDTKEIFPGTIDALRGLGA